MNGRDAQARALLTRAASVEAARQQAHQARDWPRVAECERELAALWRQHAELERQSAA